MGMALDEPKDDEQPETVNGIGILMEDYTKILADGSTLDYVTLPEGEGFTITGPGSGSCGDSCGGDSCSC